jgi:hypothetical protein
VACNSVYRGDGSVYGVFSAPPIQAGPSDANPETEVTPNFLQLPYIYVVLWVGAVLV